MINKKIVLAVAAMALLAVIPAIKATAKQKDATLLTSKNTVLVNEEVNGTSVANWIQQVRKLDSLNDSSCIVLVINSPGGSIADGMAFNEALRATKRPICTLTIFAASMAFQIVQNQGERQVLKTGILMSHRAKGGFEGEFGGPSPSQVDSRYGLWLDLVNGMDQVTVDRSKGKQTLSSYQKAYANEMWRIGQRAVDEGYADKVVSASCDDSLTGTTSHTAQTMFGDVSYELSTCPLITGPLNVKVGILTNKGLVYENEFVSQGGRFDAYCMADNKDNKLCALDTSLSPQKLTEIKNRFRSDFMAKQNKVIYMTVPSGQ